MVGKRVGPSRNESSWDTWEADYFGDLLAGLKESADMEDVDVAGLLPDSVYMLIICGGVTLQICVLTPRLVGNATSSGFLVRLTEVVLRERAGARIVESR